MELTAKTLHEVTFGAKVRGYDPAEVDDFLAAVADGVEELNERLRRATERAARAEQQIAAGVVPQEVPVPVAVSSGGPSAVELGKVWERAVAAAEEAVSEARGEAERLLAEAHAEAETTLGGAREQALRLADEAQSRLRDEIQQLEYVRNTLKGDVDQLAAYLEQEKQKLREKITDALHALDAYGGAQGSAPGVAEVSVPDHAEFAQRYEATTSPENYYTPPGDAQPQDEADNSDWQQPQAAQQSMPYDQQHHESHAEHHEASQHDSGGSIPAPPAQNGDSTWNDAAAPAHPEWQQQGDWRQSTPSSSDEESDPFLAELRRAVQDDGPLGPRKDDESINHLYSASEEEEEDDRNSFFRRGKNK